MIKLVILWFVLGSADGIDIISLRKLYYEAYESRAKADEFFKALKTIENPSDPLMLGYRGMSHLLQAKFAYNPYTKLANFSKGKDLLDLAAVRAPKNLEIRFLRFSVQTNAPKFLGYRSSIGTDKEIILREWKNCTDPDLKKRIKEFILESPYCTQKEKSALR